MKKILFCLFCAGELYAATFTVTNTNNSGAGSLLQAILDANSAGGNSTINFNIPGAPPHMITPTAFYSTSPNRIYPPFVNDNITLDATTQAGFVLGSPAVTIDANGVSGTGSCLAIVGANNCVIKGIGVQHYVNGGSGRGVSIESTSTAGADGNQVLQCKLGFISGFGNTRALVTNGDAAHPVSNTLIDSNVMSGNSIAGCQLQFNTQNTIIQNNYFGCEYGGTTALGNAYGVVILSNGGPTAMNNLVQNNVISGNTVLGVIIQAATNNTVLNNNVGLNGTQTALLGSTAVGVLVVGVGTDAADNNLVEGNVVCGCGNGVLINDNASENVVINNIIGTNTAGANLGNQGSGVLIQGNGSGPCLRNRIEYNTIRFNGFLIAGDNFGINLPGDPSMTAFLSSITGANLIDTGDETRLPCEVVKTICRGPSPDILNALLANNCYDNNLDGIDLQNNSNDNQLPPIISSAAVSLVNPASLLITATAPALPAASNFRLDFFVNTINRNPVTEGARYIGSVLSVPSGQPVAAYFNVISPTVVAGNFVSATATNLNNGGMPGDTSPYSLNVTVTTRCITCEEVNDMHLSVIQWLKAIYFSLRHCR